MKFTRLFTLSAALAWSSQISFAQIASDNAGNYGGGWTNGANGGTGFSAWSIVVNTGSNYYAGNFIGNPSVTGDADASKNVGITGLGAQAFGFYANPNNSAAFVRADRGFSAGGLTNGQTFSLKWAIYRDWETDRKSTRLNSSH